MSLFPLLLRTGQQALYLGLYLSLPVVGAALIAGVAVAIGQAITQIQEQSVGFVAKAIAVLVALVIAGGWIGAALVRFTRSVFALIAVVNRSAL
jgi:type III secretion protein S